MAFGFEGRPVCRAVILTVAIFSLYFIRNAGKCPPFSLTHILTGEYSRLFYPFVSFDNTLTLITGVALLYIFRVFESQWGSKKFGAFLFFGYFLNILLSLAMSVIMEQVGEIYNPANGPYFLVAALIVSYNRAIPVQAPSEYKVVGVSLSEKTWVYLVGLQLVLNKGLGSVLPCALGALVGLIYMSNTLSIGDWRVPSLLAKVLSLPFILLPSGEAAAPASTTAVTGAAAAAGSDPAAASSSSATERPAGQRGNRPRGPSFADATAQRLNDYAGLGPTPATDEEIDKIMDMNLGFNREEVIAAMQKSGNDVQVAAALLASTKFN